MEDFNAEQREFMAYAMRNNPGSTVEELKREFSMDLYLRSDQFQDEDEE